LTEPLIDRQICPDKNQSILTENPVKSYCEIKTIYRADVGRKKTFSLNQFGDKSYFVSNHKLGCDPDVTGRQ